MEPNQAIAALLKAIENSYGLPVVEKVQPPDGLVLEMVDGSWWAVHAYQLRREGSDG